MSREDGFFPSQRGCVCFGYFGRWTLAAMANGASPVANIMVNRRVCAKRLWHGSIGQARFGNALMAGGAAVCHVHSRQPHLINVRIVIGKKFFRVRPGLCVLHEPALIMLPLRTKVLKGRNRQHEHANDCGQSEGKPQLLRQLAHVFSRHASPRATPRTTRGRGRTSLPPLGKGPSQ